MAGHGTHVTRIALGDLQPLEKHRPARDVDHAPRILPVEDRLPRFLRADCDVLAELLNILSDQSPPSNLRVKASVYFFATSCIVCLFELDC